MSQGLFGLIMDGLVLVLLGATIIYAARLSKHLKNFRQGRKELEKLIADLSGQIVRAEGAIDGLKASAREMSRDLQAQLDEARNIGADLEIMTRGANNIADRLDKAADRNRMAENPPPNAQQSKSAPLPPNVRRPTREEFPGFAIRDAEAEGAVQPDDQSGSVAERELLEALTRKGKR